MPKGSREFRIIRKNCLVCGKELKLNNTRDIERKKYCSMNCRSYAISTRFYKQHPEHFKKMNLLGNTPKANKKKSHKKENHPCWVKDRSKVKATNHRTHYEAIRFRLGVFERDRFTCQHCGQKGGYLHAHHILSWAKYPEHRYILSNGITLCISCHKKTSTYCRRIG